MISDEELQHYTDKNRDCWPDSVIAEMARELLERRQAERAASSWDDAPENARARRVVSIMQVALPVYAYYDADEVASLIMRGKFGFAFEERPI